MTQVNSLIECTQLATNKHTFMRYHRQEREYRSERKLQISIDCTVLLIACLINIRLVLRFFLFVFTGQRNDSLNSESRRHRASGEESHSPKAANGTTIRVASVQSSSCDYNLTFPKLVSEVNQELLTSAAVILPGKGQLIQTHQPVLKLFFPSIHPFSHKS